MVIGFNGAETNCRIAQILDILLMNSYNTDRTEHSTIQGVILQTDKFLKCDWLRPVVFEPNLKYLHVKIMPFT